MLSGGHSPEREIGAPDTRTSHYWFARHWAEAIAAQTADGELAARFGPVAEALANREADILSELRAGEGAPADTGGYFRPDPAKTAAVMRPSATLNGILG